MTNELTLVSEDSRRALFEFGKGKWKVAKFLQIKENSAIGDHYHSEKDECFLLVQGEMAMSVGGEVKDIEAPYSFTVSRGTYHRFFIKGGSILICLASELHNDKDDLKP